MPPSSRSETPGGGVSGERFEIRGKLGAGGLGVVYRAFDRQRGAEVALKALREVTGADSASLASMAEASIARLEAIVRMLAPAWSDPAKVTSNRAPTSRTS